MLLYRLAPDGFLAGTTEDGLRILLSDPFETPSSEWIFGGPVEPIDPFDPESTAGRLLAPLRPGKIVGIGRNYKDHAAELGNPMPTEPLVFLKAPSSIVGPEVPVILPPESQRVEHEGEIGVVVGRRLTRPGSDEARAGILGVTCAVDVTARDLQRKDATFARGKSFDTFCPIGPGILVPDADEDDPFADLEVVLRVDGEERQRGHVGQMEWGPVELVEYAARHMTLEPGDLVLTGTPAGVGVLTDGETIETEVSGVGVLRSPVQAFRGGGRQE